MTEPVAQGLHLLLAIVLGAVIVAAVLLACQLALAILTDREARRRAAKRRHPSSRMRELLREDAREARSREAWHRLGGHDRLILRPHERDAIEEMERGWRR